MTNENFRSNEYIGQQSIECRKKKKIKQISSNFLCIMPVLLYFSFNFIDRLKKAMYIGRTKKNEEKIFICYSIFMKGFFLPDKKSAQSPNERNIWRASAVSRIQHDCWKKCELINHRCRSNVVSCASYKFFQRSESSFIESENWFLIYKSRSINFCYVFFFFFEHSSFFARQTEHFVWRVWNAKANVADFFVCPVLIAILYFKQSFMKHIQQVNKLHICSLSNRKWKAIKTASILLGSASLHSFANNQYTAQQTRWWMHHALFDKMKRHKVQAVVQQCVCTNGCGLQWKKCITSSFLCLNNGKSDENEKQCHKFRLHPLYNDYTINGK